MTLAPLPRSLSRRGGGEAEAEEGEGEAEAEGEAEGADAKPGARRRRPEAEKAKPRWERRASVPPPGGRPKKARASERRAGALSIARARDSEGDSVNDSNRPSLL